MKVLIGTPVHQVKDYSMERWLQNVTLLRAVYPADLLLVDNSPGLSYMEKVKCYCNKHGIKKYTIKHIDFDQSMSSRIRDKRIWTCNEIIRRTVLSKNYDAWFSWECDQIIPADALNKLAALLKSGIMIVAHNSWMRSYQHWLNFDMGCTLIARECLKKYSFLPGHGVKRWGGNGDDLYRIRVLKSGGNFAEVQGLIHPIYHIVDQAAK